MAPITTGKSAISKASTVAFPNPLKPKIYSTKKEPANKDANQPETAVTTGFNAFLKACFITIFLLLNPFAFAVLI